VNVAAALAVAVAAFAVWRLWLRLHPDTPCPRCKGTGRNWLSTKNHEGRCKRCGGNGKRRSRLLRK